MGPRRHTEAWTVWPFKPRTGQPHIFSPFLWTPVLLLFMGPGASGEDSAQRQRVAGTPGGSATFRLNISVDTQIENVVWNGPHGSLCLASKGDVNLMDKSYKGRIKILRPGYSLSLYNLTLKDAGSYEAQINRDDSTVTTYEEFTLGIYELLRAPLVTLKSVAVSEDASCTITLICFVQGEGKDIDYSWTPVGPHDSESSMSSTLTISWVPCGQDQHRSYTCTVRNPVSKRSSDPVFARQFCTDVGGPVEETVGLLGESIILPLSLPASQDIKRVLWIFNTSVISTWGEIATVDPDTQSKVPDKNEVSVSDQDHSLEIKQLRMEDAGHYHAYVCSKDSRVTSTKHVTLLVYGRLRKPKVTHNQTITENGSCTVQLACSVEDNAPNVKYRWTSSLQKGTVHEGSNFQASWRLGEKSSHLQLHGQQPCQQQLPDVQPQSPPSAKGGLQLSHQPMEERDTSSI
ncbi:T-lymphocyte surface antigen Ly-9-like [Talpa occidentalis]|uniref:T-lymphocyte surface antigen Ly-9-like n=1 Tax=Talpa occidentalis TaxID=50954 RepID=UPI00188F761A|nr:T-lymphocyte surface antigen Ly-9-like [Talpa occidentalis]